MEARPSKMSLPTPLCSPESGRNEMHDAGRSDKERSHERIEVARIITVLASL